MRSEQGVRLGSDASGDARIVGDAGYALAMTALLIIPLLVATAFATDYGAWLAQAAKLQRAADNAAMAGVVYMPNTTTAQTTAVNTLSANGLITTGGSKNVNVTYPATGVEQQFRVELTQTAPQYFSRLFLGGLTIKRGATAEYNKPVPLGSPANRLGNDPEGCSQSQPDAVTCPNPMMWQAINGPGEGHGQGDPYASKCAVGSNSTDCTPTTNSNPEYDPDGYLFALDVPQSAAGSTINLQAWDFSQKSRTTNNGAQPAPVPAVGSAQGVTCYADTSPFNTSVYTSGGNFLAGFASGNCQTGDGANRDANTYVQVYDNDDIDVTVSTSTPLSGCPSTTINRNDTGADALWLNKWRTFCQVTGARKGVYPFRVKTSAIPGIGTDVGTGSNSYSLRAVDAGGNVITGVRVYAIDRMSLYTNSPGSTSRFYLAEIGPEHKGKKINVDLYDPGDVPTGNAFLQLFGPAAGAPAVVPTGGTVVPSSGLATSCKLSTAQTSRTALDGATLSDITNCRFQTKSSSSTSPYNERWVRIQIQLPANYNCGAAAGVTPTDCWWTVQYDFNSGSAFPTDRTTWALRVVGDPVHLVQ